MSAEILHRTFHVLLKDQYSSIANYEANPNTITNGSDEGYQQLIDDVCARYSIRGGKGYGYFEDDEDNFPMSRILRDYFWDDTINFYNTTIRMMKVLVTNSGDQIGATGGDVVITHYRENKREYLLVAIVTEKNGSHRDGWTINKTTFFDVNSLRFAGRIDLTGWQDGDERYISFLKGSKEVSVYFKKFLGCNDEVIATQETKKLSQAILDFAHRQSLSSDAKDKFIRDAYSYLTELSNSSQEFTFEIFSNAVYPENPALIESFISDNNIQISNGFIPDKRSLRSLTSFTGRTKNWSINFTRQAISDGDIQYNNGDIIIKNIPQTLKDSLDKEFDYTG